LDELCDLSDLNNIGYSFPTFSAESLSNFEINFGSAESLSTSSDFNNILADIEMMKNGRDYYTLSDFDSSSLGNLMTGSQLNPIGNLITRVQLNPMGNLMNGTQSNPMTNFTDPLAFDVNTFLANTREMEGLSISNEVCSNKESIQYQADFL
jgi:hypothetical protein